MALWRPNRWWRGAATALPHSALKPCRGSVRGSAGSGAGGGVARGSVRLCACALGARARAHRQGIITLRSGRL